MEVFKNFADYQKARQSLFDENFSRALGSDIKLSEDEQKVNEIIMKFKSEEISRGFQDPSTFAPARHFFEARKSIESSPLFKIIQKMPKGGVLHAHDTALCSTDFVVSFTKWDHLWQWGSIEDEKFLPKFLFSRNKPEKIDNIEWRLVSEIRKEIGDEIYDQKVRKFFTLVVENSATRYNDLNVTWSKFDDLHILFGSIVEYKEAWKSYYRQALEEFYADNVQYLELRCVFPQLYDLDGKKYGALEVAKIYWEVLQEFKASHPDFIGGKVIYAPVRRVNDETFNSYLAIIKELKEKFPELIAGFDVVAQEDKGRPLKDFAERLLNLPKEIDFFFHAAETKWFGTSSDENLIDAILLGTKRIGHGFGIVKYPHLLEIIKERKICIEVNPLSNQILKLVDDLKNHPAAILFSDNYPFVISSDGPSFFGSSPLTFDFYAAFVGIASAHQDLRTLKKLILNSFEFSAMSETEKLKGIEIWQKKWDEFIQLCLKEFY